jgi:dimethylglycine dehydrogenase
MKTNARVVVIGGGCVGASIAYHLAKYGWTDVALIEKHELTSGSTWMAAGNCSFHHGNYYGTAINKKSIEIYKTLEKETGYSPGWHTTASIRTADNPDRMDELGYTYSMNKCLGLDVEFVTPSDMAKLHPLMNVDGLVGGLYWPDDGDVDPNGITQAFAGAAKKMGAEINTHTRVTGLAFKDHSQEWVVHTDKGDITCEYVVNAGGLWAPEVARMAGIEIPSIAIEHTHILFESIGAVEERDTYLPLVRDGDRSIYIRQEMDSLILGMYERNAKQWYKNGVPWDYAQTELEPDIDNIAENIEHGIFRFPIIGETGFKHVTAGPITYTPDANPLVGPAYPLKNFFLACGYSFGVTQAGGIGHYLAGWIMQGEPELDLWTVDSRRFGSYANWAFDHEKIPETYAMLYDKIYPNEWREAARPARTSPIYEFQRQANASFGDYLGWECPNWFAPAGQDNKEIPTWRQSNAFDPVKRECRHVMDHAGLLDLTRFAKARITGPGAEEWLGYLTCNRLPARDGQIALTPVLDDQGRFKTDMTVTRVAQDDYFLVTASVGKRHDHHLLKTELPKDGSVLMEDLTYTMGCFVIAGPKSRDILEKVCYQEVSTDALPFAASRKIYVGRTQCRVNRMNYVGELGFEIFHPIEQQIPLYLKLMEAGREFNLENIGMYAMESMRLEKGYLGWKSEQTIHHNPLETPVAWTVKWDKHFRGKAALEKIKETGVAQKLVALVIDTKDGAQALGYNAIYKDGTYVGMTSAGGFGHRIEKSIALGYVTPALADPGTALEVNILGENRPARVETMPLYDPDNTRMKA